MNGDIVHSLINHFAVPYYTAQEWWLGEAASPQPLFMMRAVAGSASLIATIVSFFDARNPNAIENIWDDEIIKRFRVINTIQALGFLLVSLYYLAAAILEVDRETSPHRLLVLGAAVTVTIFGYLMSAVFWRVHYLRKRTRLVRKGEDVQIK